MLLASWKDTVHPMDTIAPPRLRSLQPWLHHRTRLRAVYHFNATSGAPTPCSWRRAEDFASPAAAAFPQRMPMVPLVTAPGRITRSALAPVLLSRRHRSRYGPGSGPWTG